MVAVQQSYIIISLFIPFLFLIFNHTNRIIKWVSRTILVLVMFYIVAAIPFLILSELKYWSLMLIAIPIMFRVVSILLRRIGLFGSKSIQIVENLMFASVSSLSIIFIGASSNTLEKLFFLILIFFFLNATDFKIVEKYPYLGMLFGPIIAVIPSYDGFNVFYTAVLIWIAITIAFNSFLKIFKIKKTKNIEKSVLILYVTVFLIVTNNGGVNLSWTDIGLKILTIFVCGCLLFGCSFLINQKVPNKYRYIKHYSIVIMATIFISFLLIMMNFYEGVQLFFKPIVALIIGMGLFLSFGRLWSSFYQLMTSKAFPFQMDNLNEIMQLIFGKNLGQSLFNIVFGLNYAEIKLRVALPLFIVFIVGGAGSVSFLYPSYNVFLFDNNEMFLAFIITNSMFAAFMMLGEIASIINKESVLEGISQEKALQRSTSIIMSYSFIFIPLLIYNIDIFMSVDLIWRILGGCFLLMLYANINIMLYLDLQKPSYNHFKNTRIVASSMLQAFALALAPILIFTSYSEQFGLQFINEYNASVFVISFLAMYIAKLLSYDMEFGSKRMYLRNLLLFLFLIISTNSIVNVGPYLFLIVTRNVEQATYLSVHSILAHISLLGCSLAILLLPWSNHSKITIVSEWINLLKGLNDNKKNATTEIKNRSKSKQKKKSK
ncbi:hypothetical protein MHH56_09565 [Paenibacillus sp. FSL K6-3182]|uniref:hypothetical protein n=1 Tax=Paenibacillus sp. FSL K6-3182 TaxID=2921495 RepID=UPI0030D4613F